MENKSYGAVLAKLLQITVFLLQQNDMQSKQHICGVDLTFTCQDGANIIASLQFCFSSQFSYPLVYWHNLGRVGGHLAVSMQD